LVEAESANEYFWSCALSEMEFWDINFNKILLLHAIPSPFYWQILKKTIFFSGLKNPYKKSAKQEIAFFRKEK
jgi:hypothetical protein